VIEGKSQFYIGQIILLEGRYSRFLEGEIIGVSSSHDNSINKICSSILSLCDSIDSDQIQEKAIEAIEIEQTITKVDQNQQFSV
jgi:hypothetical protein